MTDNQMVELFTIMASLPSNTSPEAAKQAWDDYFSSIGEDSRECVTIHGLLEYEYTAC